MLVGHLAGYTEAEETCWFSYWVLKATHYNSERVFAGPLRSVLDAPEEAAPTAAQRCCCRRPDFDPCGLGSEVGDSASL